MACMGENDTETQPSFDEMEVDLRDRREDILQVFMSHDSDVYDTSELRVIADIPQGSIKFHLDKLKDWGLIVDLDERVPPSHGGGNDAKQWRLTDRGLTFTEDRIVYVAPEDVEELARRVVELEREVDDLREQHERDIREIKEEVQNKIGSLKNLLPSPNGQR